MRGCPLPTLVFNILQSSITINWICSKTGTGGVISKHPLNVNAAPHPPKPWMTEKEGQCGPGSPLCEATVVMGSEQHYATADSPGDSLSLFWFYFYLLRCCSSSQNKSFIAISSWPCTRTPRALIVLPASGIINNPKSPSSTSLSFFVWGFRFLWHPPPHHLSQFGVKCTERIWVAH